MFGFYHTHGSSGNQCFLSSKFSGRPSEGSFENVLWRKVKQMQPMWLCLLTFENTQCRKIKQMQSMWQAISGDIWKHTVEKSQTNVTKWLCILTDTQFEYRDKNTQWRKAKINVTLPHLRQAIWKHIAEKSQTNATNVIMPLLRQAIWGHIWKHTAGKSQTNATYDVILHPFTQAIWRYISKHIAGKSQTNATLYGLRGHIWKCTAEQKSNKCNYCNYASTHAHVLRSHTKKMWWEKFQKNITQMFFPHMCGKLHIQPEDNLCGFYHTCVLFHTYVWK